MGIEDQIKAHIRNLEPYKPGKPVSEVERELGIEGSIKLASNESAIGPSSKAIAAIDVSVLVSNSTAFSIRMVFMNCTKLLPVIFLHMLENCLCDNFAIFAASGRLSVSK